MPPAWTIFIIKIFMNLASLSLTKSEWSQTCAQGSSGNIFVAANVFSSFHRSEIISTWPQLSLQAFPKKASDFFYFIFLAGGAWKIVSWRSKFKRNSVVIWVEARFFRVVAELIKLYLLIEKPFEWFLNQLAVVKIFTHKIEELKPA